MAGFSGRSVAFTQKCSETDAESECADESEATDGLESTDEWLEPRRASRRQLLAAGGGIAAALLAGCSGILPGSGGIPDDEPANADANANTTETGTDTPTTPTPEVDVVSFLYRRDGSGYRFFVGLDPQRGTGGADWWQIESLDGTKLVRKAFDSPRTGDRFTTSATATIGDEVSGIVVRGHDVEFGYGGQVMLADLERGFITLEKQGSRRQSFENYSF